MVATQQTLEDMYLHTARVRYHYRNCLEMGGPIVKKKGEAGRTEARDLRETGRALGYALCCVVKCSQPVAMDYLGVRAQYAPGAGTARTKLMQRYRLTAAEAVGWSVLGRGAEPPQFWVLLIWLEPGISHVTWVHYDATMCLPCFVCSILPVLHFLRFDLFVL